MTKVINLIGAPSTGKSTLMAELFFLMKKQNLNCEMVQEWVKNLIWQDKTSILCNQHYIITEQYKSIKCLQDKIDYIILDTSLVNYIYYNNTDVKNVCNREKTEEYALKLLDEFDNIFIFVERNEKHKFESEGRIHNYNQSIIIEEEMKQLVKKLNLHITFFKSGFDVCELLKKIL